MSVSNPSRDCFAVAKRLLDIDEACRIAASMVRSAVGVETVVLCQAVGRVLAEDIIAPNPLPLFDHSAMDGYAVRILDFLGIGSTTLPVVGRQTAGSRPDELAHGTVRRIFKGAPLPVGADAVVMQERCDRDGDVVHFAELPARGDNIRRQGDGPA
jgi:molybdopterin molybdotransferase